jgi:hypothetical protein
MVLNITVVYKFNNDHSCLCEESAMVDDEAISTANKIASPAAGGLAMTFLFLDAAV